MEYSKKTILQFIISLLIAASVMLIASSCDGSDPPPSPPPAPSPEPFSFLFTSKILAEHVIGSSPCPQNIANIKTYCGRSGDSCTADSVVITNLHPGLDASFGNGQQSTSLDSNPQKNKILTVSFNCQVAMSFNHKYKLEFYKNGVKVDEQELIIDMVVK